VQAPYRHRPIPQKDRICGPRFTIGLKRSTLNLQLSTRTPADYPILGSLADISQRPGGRMRTNRVRVVAGDRVSVELTSYDLGPEGSSIFK
jgi:hypothetical protein